MINFRRVAFSLAALASLALPTGAAADGYIAKRGYKAPAEYYAPVNWSTLYFGGAVGHTWTGADWTFDTIGSAPWATAPGDTVGFDNSGWTAGGQIGWQHQFGRIVAGVELSLTGGDHQERIVSPFFPLTDRLVTDTRWMFGAAFKLGYTWDRWMAYAKVGYASASMVIRGETTAAGFVDEASSEVHNGWLAGAGLEYMFRDHISLGLDYTYMDLGSATHVLTNPVNGPIGTRVNVDPDGTHTLMARINFHLHRGGHPEAKPLK